MRQEDSHSVRVEEFLLVLLRGDVESLDAIDNGVSSHSNKSACSPTERTSGIATHIRGAGNTRPLHKVRPASLAELGTIVENVPPSRIS